MCEVDWTKPVECKINNASSWRPFRVLSYSTDYPRVVYGVYDAERLPRVFYLPDFIFRNTPPPPPEVWIVWRKQDDKVWYYGTCHEPVRNLPSEDFWQQKVTCEGPVR